MYWFINICDTYGPIWNGLVLDVCSADWMFSYLSRGMQTVSFLTFLNCFKFNETVHEIPDRQNWCESGKHGPYLVSFYEKYSLFGNSWNWVCTSWAFCVHKYTAGLTAMTYSAWFLDAKFCFRSSTIPTTARLIRHHVRVIVFYIFYTSTCSFTFPCRLT